MPTTNKNPERIYNILGSENISLPISALSELSCPAALLTIKPVAADIKSAGSWETRPSPTVNLVKVDNASIKSICCCHIPIIKPPTMFITVIIIPAVASPLTNFEAPSMVP